MTAEQIERYKHNAVHPWTFRLIEERERLLQALKDLSYTIVLREEDAQITGPGILGAREAIAYAESE